MKRFSSKSYLTASAVGALFVLSAIPAASAQSMKAGSMQSGSRTSGKQQLKSSHIRGTIVSYDGSTLDIDQGSDRPIAVKVSAKTKIAGVKKAHASDIGKGDFVGIASVPGKQGASDAVEVLIFPAAMKGSGEGSYPWDLRPNSNMTNATVSSSVTKVDGRTVTLTYDGGKTKTITIPKVTPIVTIAKASRSDLKKGNKVFVGASDKSGHKVANMIMVGNNGVAPPM